MTKTDWNYLLFFLFTAVVLEGVAAWSSIQVFPLMKGKIILASVATGVLAFIIHQLADEASPSLRQRGIIVFCILNVALLVNCLQHFDFGRELEAARQSFQEQELVKNADLQREKERADIAVKIANANTATLNEGRKTLIHTPRKQAGALAARLESSLIQAPSTAPTPIAAAPEESFDTEPVAEVKTAAQIRAELMPSLYWGLAFSFAAAVLGCTYLFAYKNWDKDENGIKDWIEEAARTLGETKFSQKYPDHYWRYRNQLFPTTAPGKV